MYVTCILNHDWQVSVCPPLIFAFNRLKDRVLMSLIGFLRQPYPYRSTATEKFWISFGISAFVFLFLLIFQPFSLNEIDSPYRYLVISGYGAVCFVVVMLNTFLFPLVFPNWFREEKWTVWTEIVFTLWNFLTIGTANLVYSAYLHIGALTLSTFFYTQFITLAVGIIPVTIAVAVTEILYLRKNLRKASRLDNKVQELHKQELASPPTHNNRKIVIKSEQERENLLLPVDDLLYIQSARNYIEVFWRGNNGDVKKALLRNSLKNTEQQLSEYKELVRCHRSYIVNFRNVIKVTANAQGFRLFLEGQKESIPASKNYEEQLAEHLN